MVLKEEELKQAASAIKKMQQGTTTVVEIFGPDGIGKTTLLNQLREQYPQIGFIVGNCDNFPSRLSFAPFLEILSQLLKVEITDTEETIHKKIEDEIKALDIGDIATSFYILTEIFGVGEEENIISKLDPKIKEVMFHSTIRDLLIRESWVVAWSSSLKISITSIPRP